MRYGMKRGPCSQVAQGGWKLHTSGNHFPVAEHIVVPTLSLLVTRMMTEILERVLEAKNSKKYVSYFI